MPEQDVNQAASKFISSLVKSLQILCNGQVEFAESIELVGHINVRVDHKYKFDYIVDEQVSKEGEDSSTTFLSNSYHSSPPTKQKNRKILPSQLEQDVMFTEIPQGFHRRNVQTDSEFQLSAQSEDNRTSELSRACDENKQGYSVTVSSPRAGSSESSQVVVKLEKGDDSNDCMVLPASPDDYEATGDASGESFPDAGPSSSYEDTHGSHPGRSRKRRKPHEQGADDMSESKGDMEGEGKSPGGKRGASELIGKFAAYECSYCSVILTEYEDLSVHSKNCPSPMCSMICLTCGEKFTSKPEMRQHLKFVHSHKTFGCKFCEMMFLSSSGLLSHTKAKHKPDPKTLCQICGQAFHNRANLEGHMNMHLGLKPFKCKKCGKSYGHSKSLFTHEKSCKSRLMSGKTKPLPSPNQQTEAKTEILTSNNSIGARTNTSQQHTEGRLASETDRTTSDLEVAGSNPAYSFSESYQTFEDNKKILSQEADLQTLHNAGQAFSYGNSYQALQSIDMSSITNTSNVNEALGGDGVFAQPSADFVLPQVTYGMFPPGLLPDHR